MYAFANSNGGAIYEGLDDKGNPVEQSNIKKLLENIPNKIRNHLGIIPSVKIENRNGVDVIKIEINPSDVPISYNGKFYVRVGATTEELIGSGLVKFILKKQNLSWDMLPSETSLDEVEEHGLLEPEFK